MKKIILSFILMSLLSACTTMEQRKEEYVGLVKALDVNTATSKVKVSNDPYSSVILYDTRLVVPEPGNPLNEGSIFIVGMKDKKTGKKTYSVMIDEIYTRDGWKFYDRVAYTSFDEIKEAKLDKVGLNKVISCNGRYGCTYQETTSFLVPNELFEKIKLESEKNPELMKKAWKFKIYTKSTEPFEFGFVPAEIIGLINSMK